MSSPSFIDGGVTAPKGFRASGIHSGIKEAKPDMALVVSETPATVAAVFTTNKIQGAPVRICRRRLPCTTARAIIVNSGNANACNGPQGMADAERMGRIAAQELGVDEETVFVCSTGTIGVPLPMDRIEKGIKAVAAALTPSGGDSSARAIMTTDTVDKQAAVEIEIGGVPVRIGGMAKGAGMIEPNMATMLAFLTTDAAVDSDSLQKCLSLAVSESFNKITVDGDQSCNDTVLFMAGAAAGNDVLDQAGPDWPVFDEAVKAVTRTLAMKIVEDGEGATKFVTVKVKGAVSDDDAVSAARAVANSLLVKTSWYGGDPNWGRIIDAVGRSGAEVREELVDISYDGLLAVKGGQAASNTVLKDLENILAKRRFTVTIELHLDRGRDTVYTCDCSEEYVRINSEYMT